MSEASKKDDQTRVSKSKAFRFRESRITLPEKFSSHALLKNFYGDEVTAKVVNLSQFGARIEVDTKDFNLHKNELIKEASVFVNHTKVYSGSIKVVNEAQIDIGRIAYGIIFNDDGIDVEKVRAILEMDGKEDEFIITTRNFELSDLVSPRFKELVADLNTVLQEVRIKLLHEEMRIKDAYKDGAYQQSLCEHAISIAFSVYGPEVNRIFSKFQELSSNFVGDEISIHKKYFRINFHPILMATPFVNRSFTKPLGYSGDYGLMVMLYEYEDLGGNLFDKFFHRFCCNQIVTLANKNRVEVLSQLIVEDYTKCSKKADEFKISSIACGPAREIQLALDKIENDHGPRIEIKLIDNEPMALEHARRKLSKNLVSRNCNIEFFQEDAILGIIKKRPFANEMENSDVIVCAGLFDYLSDRVSAKLIESLFAMLKPCGRLLIGNVSKSNPDRFSMEYGLDWHLVLRSKDDLLNLVPSSIKAAAKVDVISESLGVNLFLSIIK